MAKVIVCASTKGGVSKTTTTVNLAAAVAERGYRVLLVDFDPQGHSSLALNVITRDLPHTLTNVIMPDNQGETVPIEKAIYKTNVENLHLAASYLTLTLANMALSGKVARERVLAKELRKTEIENQYDFIFMDTNPATDILLMNALAASDYLIGCSKSEFSSLDGVEMMLDQMQLLKDSGINPTIKFLGVMVSQKRETKHDTDTMETLKKRYNILGCTTLNTKVNEAFREGIPAVKFAPKTAVSKEYRRVADELIQRYEAGEL